MAEEKIIIIDDRKIPYTEKETILEICDNNGIKIPQMCFQKNLTPSGHCGLCVIELFDESLPTNWVPILACVLLPQPGLKIRTHSDIIDAIRTMTGQLLLRSHPCDCNFCERFGNCELRKIYNRTGFGFTRAIEDGKRQNSVITRLSGRFLLDREKCTNCGLCVTFFREELGEDFLHSVLKNNGQSRLELYPTISCESKYLLNAIEICPFNAIIDGESLGYPPPWQLQAIDGISTESSTGNNIKIFVQSNEIMYLKPRPNPNIGNYIPDSIRDIHRNNNKDRVDYLTLHGQKVGEREAIIFLLSKIGFKHRCTMICDGSISLENMLLARLLADVLGAKIFVKNHRQEGDGWLISSDQNTNIRGALLTQVIKKETVEDFTEVEDLIANRQIQTLIILNEDILAMGFSKENFAKVNSITFSCKKNETTQNSHLILPLSTTFEEDGHFINKDFLLQRFHRAIVPKTEAKPLWKWLAMLRDIYTGRTKEAAEFQSIEAIWRFLEKSIPEFKHVNFSELPPTGMFLENNRFKNYPCLA
ncbi:MAG: molybdopterin-dependent oxidoreductase [Puniceicoccales bacterium]|nr:molybdopterin-dependent oxidoreductase [Puniceicoccales bacterium]